MGWKMSNGSEDKGKRMKTAAMLGMNYYTFR